MNSWILIIAIISPYPKDISVFQAEADFSSENACNNAGQHWQHPPEAKVLYVCAPRFREAIKE